MEALYPDTWEWQVGVVRLDLPWCFACPLCFYSRIVTFSILFELHFHSASFGHSHDACDKLAKQASPRLWRISSSLGPSKRSSHVNVYTGCLDCFLSIFYFQLVISVNLSDLCPVLLCLVNGSSIDACVYLLNAAAFWQRKRWRSLSMKMTSKLDLR